MSETMGHRQWASRLIWALEIQLLVMIFTIPAGRIGGSEVGLPFSLGGNTYKLFTPFFLTWCGWWWLAGPPRLRWGRFTAPMLGFLLAGVFANAGTPYLYDSLKWVLKYGLCLLFYVSFINTPWSTRTVKLSVAAFLAGNAYLCTYVLYEKLVAGAYRVEGTFGYPNLLGAYAVLALPLLLLIAYRSATGSRLSWLAYGIGVLLFLAAGLTLSRAASIGLISGLVILWLAGRRHTLPQILPLLAVGLLLWAWAGGHMWGRWSELGPDLAGARPESRLRIWNETFDEVMPGARVSGIGTADQFQDRWWGQRLLTEPTPVPRFNHAHSLPLQMLVTMGLPGLVVLAWITIIIVRAVPPWSPEGVWGRRGDAAYLLAGAVGFGLFGLVDMVLFTKNVTAMAVCYLGLIDLMVPVRGRASTEASVWVSADVAPDCQTGASSGDHPYSPVAAQRATRAFLTDPLSEPVECGPLRVLHLYANYRYTGPAENVLAMAELTRVRGHHVAISCPASAPKVRLSSRGISVRPGESGRESDLRRQVDDLGLETGPPLALNRHLNLLDNLSDLRCLREILSGNDFDVVHVHQPHDRNLTLLAASRPGRRVAVVASHHKSGPPGSGALTGTLMSRGIDLLLVLSERDRHETVDALGLGSEVTAVLPAFVDASHYRPDWDSSSFRETMGVSADTPLFGVVARFQPYRRHDLVVEAWNQVRSRHPDARLALIGRGEYQPEIARMVSDLELQDRVLFPGYLRGDDFARAVSGLDGLIYLRPGSDGSCRAVLQAMACGVAPIVGSVGLLPDLVTGGDSGVLLESDTSASIADAVCRLCENRNDLRRLGDAARRRVLEHHTADAVATRVERAYCYAMRRRGLRLPNVAR